MAKQDPTKTTRLRKQFAGEAAKRFRSLAGLIREAVVDEDVLALKINDRDEGSGLSKRAFDFSRDSKKVDEFMAWLNEMAEREILDVRDGRPKDVASEDAWTAKYIKRAYHSGIKRAAQRLKKQGAEVSDSWVEEAMNREMHADAVGTLYTRAFRELRGITDELDKQISRELAEGLSKGEHPRKIAARLSDRTSKIGKTRARVLARTETINAFSESTLNSYEEAGLDEVEGEPEAEFSTAGDSRVCPRCEGLSGRIFSLSEARGVIPVHPNCRCSWLPVIKDANGLKLS